MWKEISIDKRNEFGRDFMSVDEENRLEEEIL